MEKKEFESKFVEIMRKKVPMSAKWEQSLRAMLCFIDEHKIYEYKSYDDIIDSAKSLKVYYENTSRFIKQNGCAALYIMSLHSIVISENNIKKQTNPEFLIHELTHALSTTRISTVNSFYRKYSIKESDCPIDTSVIEGEDYETYIARMKKEISAWYEENDYLLQNPQKINPGSSAWGSGFGVTQVDYSIYLNYNLMRRKIKSFDEVKDYVIGSKYNGKVFNEIIQRVDQFNNIEEGVTELSTLLSLSRLRGGIIQVPRYIPYVMMAYQLYGIFGESLFEAYWLHDISPMAESLNIYEGEIAELFSRLECVSVNLNNIKANENMGEFFGECQLNCLRLFEKKMFRELAKYNHDFYNGNAMRMAIIEAYKDYASRLWFGIGNGEVVNPYINKIWEEVEKSYKRCERYANILLEKRRLPKMRPIEPGVLDLLKAQNYMSYMYIDAKKQNITLADKVAESKNVVCQVVADERRQKDFAKEILTKRQVQKALGQRSNLDYSGVYIPGAYAYNIADGMDQVELMCELDINCSQNNGK